MCSLKIKVRTLMQFSHYRKLFYFKYYLLFYNINIWTKVLFPDKSIKLSIFHRHLKISVQFIKTRIWMNGCGYRLSWNLFTMFLIFLSELNNQVQNMKTSRIFLNSINYYLIFSLIPVGYSIFCYDCMSIENEYCEHFSSAFVGAVQCREKQEPNRYLSINFESARGYSDEPICLLQKNLGVVWSNNWFSIMIF